MRSAAVVGPDPQYPDDGVTIDLTPIFLPRKNQKPGNWKFMMTREEGLDLGRALVAACESAGTNDAE